MKLTVDGLVEACGDESFASGILITASLEPLAGTGGPVKPAVYAGGRYQEDTRWHDGEQVPVVVIDNVPSQANRLEAALDQVAQQGELPRVVLDLSKIGHLPPHLPSSLSGYSFPHRSADAYLRDATLDGEAFPKTDVGQAILAATAERPEALFRWFPQALLLGFWVSHLGKKASQAKLARSWVSEIVGIAPAATSTTVHGIKGDPLNLNTDNTVVHNPDFTEGWQFGESREGKKPSGSKKKESLAEIGHGQVPITEANEAKAAISFRSISQRATVSFAALRRVHAATPEASAAGRALLVCLGILGHRRAFGRSFSLRSGCELRTVSSTWTWLGEMPSDDQDIDPLSVADALSLLRECRERAAAAGLPVGNEDWSTARLDLEPNPELVKVIQSSYPQEP